MESISISKTVVIGSSQQGLLNLTVKKVKIPRKLEKAKTIKTASHSITIKTIIAITIDKKTEIKIKETLINSEKDLGNIKSSFSPLKITKMSK
jgi:hypothetical protein